MQAYVVCIRVTPECKWMELGMIRDGWGHADDADKAYHDSFLTSLGAAFLLLLWGTGGLV